MIIKTVPIEEVLVIKLNVCETLNLSNYVFEKTKKIRWFKPENTESSLITILVNCLT